MIISQIANEVGTPTAEIIELCKRYGLPLKDSFAEISEAQAAEIKEYYNSGKTYVPNLTGTAAKKSSADAPKKSKVLRPAKRVSKDKDSADSPAPSRKGLIKAKDVAKAEAESAKEKEAAKSKSGLLKKKKKIEESSPEKIQETEASAEEKASLSLEKSPAVEDSGDSKYIAETQDSAGKEPPKADVSETGTPETKVEADESQQVSENNAAPAEEVTAKSDDSSDVQEPSKEEPLTGAQAMGIKIVRTANKEEIEETKASQSLESKRPRFGQGRFVGTTTAKVEEVESEGDGKSKGIKKKKSKRILVNKIDEDGESGIIVRKFDKRPGRSKDGTKLKGKEKRVFGPRKKEIYIDERISVVDLASTIGIKVDEIIKTLSGLDVEVTSMDHIDSETAQLVAEEFNIKTIVRETVAAEAMPVEEIDNPEDLKPRPPVVTVMGHVDHGKTSLLDYIRKANVTKGEAGGITQHIGAYFVNTKQGNFCFLDTPGHEAFSAMRSRGANATDIVILIVSADDGPMPQTVEAISHAQAAEVPIIVAINKCDKPDSDPVKVQMKLMEHGLVTEEYGGDTTAVQISALKGTGIDSLLEILHLQAETMEMKANPNKKAKGIVIESRLDKSMGFVASVLVREGTLKRGDHMVIGNEYGRVRALINDQGKQVKEAGPSVPVEIMGLNGLPNAGELFQVGSDEKEVRAISEARKDKLREIQDAPKLSMENLFSNMMEEQKQKLNLIVKADVIGSSEAIKESLLRLSNDEISINLLHSGVGAISNSDVTLAAASNAILIAFNVRPDSKAKKLAEEEGIEIRYYNVIYNIIDEISAAVKGMLKPTFKEVHVGRAEVLNVFNIPNVGAVAGCKVTEGKAVRNLKVRILRDNVVLKDAEITSLKRFKDDAQEVMEGFECGIGIKNFKDVQVGDSFEFYSVTENPS